MVMLIAKKKKKCLYLGKARCKGKNAETYYTKKTEVGRQCKLLITTTITDTQNDTYYMPGTVLTTSYIGGSIYS